MPGQHNIIVTATIDGTPIGQVQTYSGGEMSAASLKAWRGAGSGETERAGRVTTSNITLSREDNGSPTVAWLRSKIRRPVRVHYTPTDADNNPRMAEQVEFTGRLLNVRLADADTMEEAELARWEIEVGVDT